MNMDEENYALDGFGEDDDVDIEMALANLAALSKVSKKKVAARQVARKSAATLSAKGLLTPSNRQLLLGMGVGLLLAYLCRPSRTRFWCR